MRNKIASYFLESDNAYTGAPRLKVKSLVYVASALGFVFLVVVFAWSPSEPIAIARAEVPQTQVATSEVVNSIPVAPSPQTSNQPRAFGASQIVSSSSASGPKLPMGSAFTASTLNAVVSSDAAAPVIAIAPQGAYFQSQCIIEAGAKLIGNASLDQRSRRLQVRFHTVVFSNAEQRPISALALSPDGSSGIAGDFSSGNAEQQVGRFTGTFVGGLAEGLKDRQSGGLLSSPLEPGSIKNGLLNGLADAASDQAARFSNEMQNAAPVLTVPANTAFLVYLDQEFTK